MCRRVLIVVLWFLIGTRLRFLAVELLSTIEPLGPSQCLFGMILVYLVFDDVGLAGIKAEPMLSS